jgi:hypothetical protein
VVIAIASPVEENTVDFKKRKLESLEFQRDVTEDSSLFIFFILS